MLSIQEDLGRQLLALDPLELQKLRLTSISSSDVQSFVPGKQKLFLSLTLKDSLGWCSSIAFSYIETICYLPISFNVSSMKVVTASL